MCTRIETSDGVGPGGGAGYRDGRSHYERVERPSDPSRERVGPTNRATARRIRKFILMALICGAVLHQAARIEAGPWWGWSGWGWGWPAGASTAEGDILRRWGAYGTGLGDYLTGLGKFEQHAAVAESIHTDSAIRVNEYLFQSNQLAAIRMRAADLRAIESHNLAYDRIQKRIRLNPNYHDIETGDALNSLTRELLSPSVHPSTLRMKTVRIPGEVLYHLPITLPHLGVVIAPTRLRADGNWPLLLRGPNFDRGRRAYGRAVAAALEQATHRALSPAGIDAVDHAIDDLRDRFEAAAGTAHERDYVNARKFLDGLSKSARMLSQPEAEAALVALLSHSLGSVADLLEVIRGHQLQFGRATRRRSGHPLTSCMTCLCDRPSCSSLTAPPRGQAWRKARRWP